MIIYGSTQYVNLEEVAEPYLQLQVINMWDCISRPVCFTLYKQGEINQTISYVLNKVTQISKDTCKVEVVTEITDEIKDELVRLGYVLK